MAKTDTGELLARFSLEKDLSIIQWLAAVQRGGFGRLRRQTSSFAVWKTMLESGKWGCGTRRMWLLHGTGEKLKTDVHESLELCTLTEEICCLFWKVELQLYYGKAVSAHESNCAWYAKLV